MTLFSKKSTILLSNEVLFSNRRCSVKKTKIIKHRTFINTNF